MKVWLSSIYGTPYEGVGANGKRVDGETSVQTWTIVAVAVSLQPRLLRDALKRQEHLRNDSRAI
jgi:hypothetical protein